MKNTTETLPPGVPETACPIKSDVVDPQAIEEGTLWIYDPKLQKLVSALAEPTLFDLLVSQYVTLLDRNAWPLGHRAALLSGYSKTIQTFYISRNDLPSDLLEDLNRLNPVETDLSIQFQIEGNVAPSE